MDPAIKDMQTTLNGLGFPCGPADGIGGAKTAGGLQAFFDKAGLRFLVAATATDIAITGPLAPQSTAVALPWMKLAETMLGLHERHDNAALRRFLSSNGKYLGDPAKLPWCGDFTESLFVKTLPNEPFPGDLGVNPFWARNWLLFGSKIEPCFGAVVVFARGSGGHVGNLVGQDETHFHVLGGNQSDGVTTARIARSRSLGTRWPKTWIRPRTIHLPRMKPGATKITHNEA